MLPATPANSVVVFPMSAISNPRKIKNVILTPGILADQVCKPFPGDDAHPGIHFLDDDQYDE